MIFENSENTEEVQVAFLTNVSYLRLHSSVGRASHWHRGGHGFKSRWSLRIFGGLSLQLLSLLHNCEDHFHFYSLSAVHIHMIYIICTSFHSSLCYCRIH